MENLVIEVSKRQDNELKKNAARRLRREGFIPAVLYGLNKDPICIKVDVKEFKELSKGRGATSLIFDMQINGDKKNKKDAVLLKDIQRDPISREFIHLDFLRIQMEKEVETTVPIVIINEEESLGVKEDEGVVQHGMRELHILCLPKNIPEKIEYDIKNMRMGDRVKVSDIEVSENIKVLNDSSEIVVSIIHPTHLKEEAEAEEEAVEEVEEEPELVGKGKKEDKEKREEEPTSKEKKS